MPAIRSLFSSLRGALWLVRRAGLREEVQSLQRRVEGLQAQLTDNARLAEALVRQFRSRTVVRGHTLLLNPADAIVSRAISEAGGFEWFETALVEREVREGDVVLDLGANIGYYTVLFARLVGPRGRVVAFEPDPVNYDLLRRNVHLNGYRNVELVNKAVSDATGQLALHRSDTNHGDHRLYDSGDGRASVQVATTTLDDHFGDDMPTVNFLKMDIQGSEQRALRGMARLLGHNPSLKLITEFWPVGLARAGSDAGEYLRQLRAWGFALQEIDEAAERLVPADDERLLGTYTPERRNYTNLFGVRG